MTPEVRRFLRRGRRLINSVHCEWEYRRFCRWVARQSPGRALSLDLDNTLVDSGRLLRQGLPLRRAAYEGALITASADLVEELRSRDRELCVFILSARPLGMRAGTRAWLGEQLRASAALPLWLVPEAYDKIRFWREARRYFRNLIIVDDLCYGHESGTPASYLEIVAAAEHYATRYIGREEIENLKRNPELGKEIARSCAGALD